MTIPPLKDESVWRAEQRGNARMADPTEDGGVDHALCCQPGDARPLVPALAEVPEKLCSISNHLTETVPWPTALGKQSP